MIINFLFSGDFHLAGERESLEAHNSSQNFINRKSSHRKQQLFRSDLVADKPIAINGIMT